MKFVILIYFENLSRNLEFYSDLTSTMSSDFHEICYFNIFRESVEIFRVLLRFDKHNEFGFS